MPAHKLACALLVDDDQTTNYLNQLLLKRMAVAEKLLVAVNGRDALALVENHCHGADGNCPMLILLDVKMPVMNGFEFLEAYAQLPTAQRQATIIVVLTTSLHPRDVSRLQQYNIAGFLSKPLTPEKVHEVLRQHFDVLPPGAA